MTIGTAVLVRFRAPFIWRSYINLLWFEIKQFNISLPSSVHLRCHGSCLPSQSLDAGTNSKQAWYEILQTWLRSGLWWDKWLAFWLCRRLRQKSPPSLSKGLTISTSAISFSLTYFSLYQPTKKDGSFIIISCQVSESSYEVKSYNRKQTWMVQPNYNYEGYVTYIYPN